MFKRCTLVKRQYCNAKLFSEFIKRYRLNYKRIDNVYYLSQRSWNTFDKFVEECSRIEQQYQKELELSNWRERMYEEKLWRFK